MARSCSMMARLATSSPHSPRLMHQDTRAPSLLSPGPKTPSVYALVEQIVLSRWVARVALAGTQSITRLLRSLKFQIWDIESKSPVTSWTLGGGVDSQQVGGVWSPAKEDEIVSLSFDGTLNVLDARQSDKPSQRLYGRKPRETLSLLLALTQIVIQIKNP